MFPSWAPYVQVNMIGFVKSRGSAMVKFIFPAPSMYIKVDFKNTQGPGSAEGWPPHLAPGSRSGKRYGTNSEYLSQTTMVSRFMKTRVMVIGWLYGLVRRKGWYTHPPAAQSFGSPPRVSVLPQSFGTLAPPAALECYAFTAVLHSHPAPV